MERRMRCRGCFAQLGKDAERCAFCGRLRDADRQFLDGWETGRVLDRRYMLGDLYMEKEHRAIWRVYDGVLDIPCFLLRWREGEDSPLGQEMRFDGEGETDYEMLGYRKIDGHPAWVFSMKDPYLHRERCRILDLFSRETSPKTIKVQAEWQGKDVLPEDTLLADRYLVLGTIGIGGFGITYLCEDINMGRNVAVKEYFPAQWSEREDGEVSIRSSNMITAFRYGKKAFSNEIKVLAQFIHAQPIVTVYDGFSANDTYYMVMEYLPGKSMGRVLRDRRHRPVSAARWKKVMASVLDGLDILHGQNILHGDISPGNIICTGEEEVKLIDLGSARKWQGGQGAFMTAFLKPDFASPEQYQAAQTGRLGAGGPWSDIYSLGATMYYCLTGRKPPSILERLKGGSDQMAFTTRDRLRIPAGWRELIGRCMELDRRKRPQSVEEIRGKM